MLKDGVSNAIALLGLDLEIEDDAFTERNSYASVIACLASMAHI